MFVEQLLLDSQAAAAAITASRLLSCGLAKDQRATFVFLLINAVSAFMLSLFGLRSDHYFWWYLACSSATDLAAIAAVRELFSITVADYPGIRTAGKITLYAVIAASALLSLVISAWLWRAGPKGWLNLYYVLNLHRSVAFSLTVAIVTLLIFLSRYPLELRRNFYISSYFFSAVFLADAADTMVATLSPNLFSFWADMAEVALIAIFFIVWAFQLRKEGIVPRRVVFKSAKDDELLHQLEALNHTLSRIGRR